MTDLNNIKKIVINGNEITKVAKHYNKNAYADNKIKTAATVQALEEAIEANKVPCDFEFNKQHETNVIYDELIVKDTDGTKYFDYTYNISITRDDTAKTFSYSETSLANVNREKVYIASTVKDFNTNEIYTLATGDVKFSSISQTIKEVIISDRLDNINLDSMDERTTPLIIRANALNMTSNKTDIDSCYVYITGTYTDCALGDGVEAGIVTGTNGELHLSSNFFDNEDIDTATASQFGNLNSCQIKRLYIERNDLNTTSTDDTQLITRLKTILNTNDNTTIIFE